MIPLLAAIRSVSPTPSSATPGMSATPAPAVPAATPELIRDIAPPVDYFPYPPWVVALAVAGCALLLGLAIWGLWQWWKHRPAPPPPSAQARALRQLNVLATQVESTDPYAFSIAVSHVLREYVEGQFHIPALEQTSPEFLAAIAGHATFTEDHRLLLADFLERCDAIKFGRAGGDTQVNAALLHSARSFVEGGPR